MIRFVAIRKDQQNFMQKEVLFGHDVCLNAALRRIPTEAGKIG
jgi:hypothetical protein